MPRQPTESSMKPLNIEQVRKQHGKALQAELKILTTKNIGVLAAQVCSVDGFEVAAVQRDEESRRRLAAMCSSIHALGCALVQEVSLGSYENLVLEGSQGKVLMMSVPNSDGSLLLTAIASAEALFGHFHYACKACCDALGETLTKQAAQK